MMTGPRILLLALVPILTAQESAAQPYSTSLAQCAGLYQNAAQWVSSEESVERLMAMTRRFHAASIARAQAEGIADPEGEMTRLMDRQTEEWEALGSPFFFSQDYRDWTSYCRKFGRSQGIDVTP